MAQVNVRIDDDLKASADVLFSDLGLTLSAAINVFIRQSVRDQKIPFEIARDPFWSEANQAEISRRTKELESGKTTLIVKTMEELEAMANE